MTILLFIIVLIALILVHEFGHFVAAKWAKMRVDEFGFGFPPRLWGYQVGETLYSVNALPFGGFVKIYGEDGDGERSPRSFAARPKWQQALVLIAGIAMNIVFAWILIAISLSLGMPRALAPGETTPDATLMVANVLADSPAAEAGLRPGDQVRGLYTETDSFEGADPVAFTSFVAEEGVQVYTLSVLRSGEPITVTLTPRAGVIESDPSRAALGVAVASVGTLKTPWWQAPIEGAILTWELTKQTAVGLTVFFASLFTFTADLSQVAGPVGIAGAVGDASAHGLTALLTLTAVISINLALINILPLPALDGGRLLFVVIEAVTRRPINTSVVSVVNLIGFAFLILLMLAVTASDIFKLVG